MDSDTVQWCNLPKDMLIMVAKCLDSSTEMFRLRAVCSSWRSSITSRSLNKSPNFLSFQFPFPIAPNPALNPNRGDFFTLSERTIFYLEPSSFENPNDAPAASPKGWMVKVEEDKLSGKLRILDTFLSNWLLSRNALPAVLDSLNFRVTKVSKAYDLCKSRSNLPYSGGELKSLGVLKVVMSSIPAWLDHSNINVDFAILTILIEGKLGYFKLGDEKWTIIDDGQVENTCYVDILYHKEKFYAVDDHGKMIVIDSSLNIRVIESPFHHDGGIQLLNGAKFKFLVESNGDLYFIDMHYTREQYRKYNVKVYKLNEEEKYWVQVSSLGDQAFIIGHKCCFSVSARQFSGCKGNCIYFKYDFFSRERYYNPSYDICIFDLEDERVRPLSSFEGHFQIFWPPPTWLKPEVSSEPSSS